jgi:hypothetical protein
LGTFKKQFASVMREGFCAKSGVTDRRPDVVAIKADVFPVERSDVGEERVGQNFALGAKLGDSAAEIDGVPEGDNSDREVETRGPVALILEGAVADLAVTMENRARASAFLASPLLSPAAIIIYDTPPIACTEAEEFSRPKSRPVLLRAV